MVLDDPFFYFHCSITKRHYKLLGKCKVPFRFLYILLATDDILVDILHNVRVHTYMFLLASLELRYR